MVHSSAAACTKIVGRSNKAVSLPPHCYISVCVFYVCVCVCGRSCLVCTLDNEAASPYCDVCGSERPADSVPAAAGAGAEGGHDDRIAEL